MSGVFAVFKIHSDGQARPALASVASAALADPCRAVWRWGLCADVGRQFVDGRSSIRSSRTASSAGAASGGGSMPARSSTSRTQGQSQVSERLPSARASAASGGTLAPRSQVSQWSSQPQGDPGSVWQGAAAPSTAAGSMPSSSGLEGRWAASLRSRSSEGGQPSRSGYGSAAPSGAAVSVPGSGGGPSGGWAASQTGQSGGAPSFSHRGGAPVAASRASGSWSAAAPSSSFSLAAPSTAAGSMPSSGGLAGRWATSLRSRSSEGGQPSRSGYGSAAPSGAAVSVPGSGGGSSGGWAASQTGQSGGAPSFSHRGGAPVAASRASGSWSAAAPSSSFSLGVGAPAAPSQASGSRGSWLRSALSGVKSLVSRPPTLSESLATWSKESGVDELKSWLVAESFLDATESGTLRPSQVINLELPSLPDVFDRMSGLRSVELHDNFGPELPPSFTSSTSLQTLDVSETAIQRLPEDLGSMPSLKSIDVRATNISRLPDSVDPSRISVIADTDVLEQAYDRLYERTPSESSRSRLAPRLGSISSRMSVLQDMRSLGLISEQAWSQAHSRMVNASMKSSNTLSGNGLAKDAEITTARQGYSDASGLVSRLAASNQPLSVDHLLAINSLVGSGGRYHPNISASGDSYGSFRSRPLPVPERADYRMRHPEPSRLSRLTQDLVDRVNSEVSRLRNSDDVASKVEAAAECCIAIDQHPSVSRRQWPHRTPGDVVDPSAAGLTACIHGVRVSNDGASWVWPRQSHPR